MRNRAETLAYLRMLAGERPDGRYLEIRSRPAGQPWMRRTAIPAGELDRAATLITRLAVDRDVFVGVALRTRPDAGGRDAIDGCHLAFVEIDTADGARRLEEFRYPPTARVGSGTEKHVHAYWRLTRPVAGEELEAANRKLAAHLAGDPASIDVARLLRPPGSMNQKHRPAGRSRGVRPGARRPGGRPRREGPLPVSRPRSHPEPAALRRRQLVLLRLPAGRVDLPVRGAALERSPHTPLTDRAAPLARSDLPPQRQTVRRALITPRRQRRGRQCAPADGRPRPILRTLTGALGSGNDPPAGRATPGQRESQMATTSTTTAINTSSEVAQLRHIPLSRIVVVPDAFNPRGVVADDRELDALAESLRCHGCLQPIRVRATNDGDYLLIAGERRYRAAVKAALMELPAIIRPAGAGDAEEQAQLLIEAVIENDQRVNLDALARARGYQRLIDSGLTVRGVAQRLTTTQARVREHLRILRLPEPAQAKLASGVVPLRAVKALATLTRIHPGLAQAAIAQILDVDEHDSERYTWADLERAPLDVAAAGDELPDGVYRTHVPYPLDGFELSERTRKDLAALEQLLGHSLGTVRFGPAELEQARRLGAAHGEERRPPSTRSPAHRRPAAQPTVDPAAQP